MCDLSPLDGRIVTLLTPQSADSARELRLAQDLATLKEVCNDAIIARRHGVVLEGPVPVRYAELFRAVKGAAKLQSTSHQFVNRAHAVSAAVEQLSEMGWNATVIGAPEKDAESVVILIEKKSGTTGKVLQ